MCCIHMRQQRMVAVGTALADRPRTIPSVRNYRTGLLPWVRGGRARLREWMHGAGLGYPPGRDAAHPVPVEPGPLAAAPQRRAPVPDHLGAEGVHRIAVAGHRVISLVPAYHGGQRRPWSGRGRHRRRLSSAFTSASLARARFEPVLRLTQNRPLLEVAQMCVNPRLCRRLIWGK
jgi:hypothetical protein